MTAHRLLNIAMATAFIAAWMATAAHFDKERFEGDMRHDADTQVQQRKQAAALKICGPGASTRWIDETTLECSLHNGRGQATVVAGVTL